MKSVTTDDGRRTRWADHRQKRRVELLRTIRHVVAEHGADISMEQISAHSRTTKAALYRYFRDRAGLQQALGEWSMGVIRTSLDSAVAEPTDPYSALHAMIKAFVELAAASPEVYRFCDSAVNPGRSNQAPGFLNDVTTLLCAKMGLHDEHEIMWAYGAIGFVRACTERWLYELGDPQEFAAQLTSWVWNSRTTSST